MNTEPAKNVSQRRSTRQRPVTNPDLPPATRPGTAPGLTSARSQKPTLGPSRDAEARPIQPRSLSKETYAELCRRAGRVVNGRKAFEPKSLVHRAWLRLGRHDRAVWKSRSHFLNVASLAMHQIFIDELRKKKLVLLSLSVLDLQLHIQEADYLVVNEILKRLKKLDPRQFQLVWNKVFCGMTTKENAQAIEVSESTIEAEWRHARAWLRTQFEKDPPKGARDQRYSSGIPPKPLFEDR